ncbi:hypothetical protein AAH979_24460 [Plantactinospora sp. ZYX-F-223]|uniref:hypothetical protein n=1 Tax=Plantactinospora sp. ZYX-F-223 TaxID=3144103 RepID=UPI0031FD87C3
MADPDTVEGAALARVLRQAGGAEILNTLGVRLSGSDLVTLLLAAFRTRAGFLTPADVLRRYTEDRFVAPAQAGFRRLRQAEDLLLSAVPDRYELLTLAPVAPLGTHSVVAGVNQNNVLATVRGSEVAADPTNGLALEAAVRRRELLARDGRSAPAVRLATLQRVIRAQRFAGAGRFAHFSLLALVTAGRDTGSLAFERRSCGEQLRILCAALEAAGVETIEIALTVLDPAAAPIAEAARAALADHPTILVRDDPDRSGGRRYYSGWCFKIGAVLDGERVELGDGGFVDWTRRLLGNHKERLLISAVSVDRLALFLDPPAPRSED